MCFWRRQNSWPNVWEQLSPHHQGHFKGIGMTAILKTEACGGAVDSSVGPSIFMSSAFAGAEPVPRESRTPHSSRDLLVYLTLVALTWGAWQISRLQLFEAGDDVGYWLGVAGGVMMVLLFSYPLRKRFRFAQSWGKAKWWFLVHMLLGVGGPILILIHSTFEVRSMNAAAAFYSMIIVALSGVVGRFIYSRINRGLHGEQVDFLALQQRAGLHQREAHSRLRFAPSVERRLMAFGRHEVSLRPGLWMSLRRVFWLPVKQWWTYLACVRELQGPLQDLAAQGAWSQKNQAKRQHLARKLVRRYLNSVVRVAQFTAYERLFSLWHVAHLPFVYLLVISALFHVFAVHAY